MSRLRKTALVAAALAALALPAAASADFHAVIKDCAADGKLDRKWPRQDLKDALKVLPTDIREYTDCAALIKAQLTSGGGGTSSGVGAGALGGANGGGVTTPSGATAASPADVAALNRETDRLRGQRPTIAVAGQNLTPAASGLDHVPGAANRLPLSLLLAILAVAALCAAGGAAAGWRSLAALRRAPRRIVRR
jgi:hypothetical protein